MLLQKGYTYYRWIMNKGLFITFEGGEGSGKSTVIQQIKQQLLAKQLDVFVTREPGGSGIGEEIRQTLLKHENTNMDPLTESYLFAAARRQHLMEYIVPKLEADVVVLCDRYVDSSVVYQGYARGIGVEKVAAINKVVIEDYVPQLTFFIDVSPEIALARIQTGRDQNRLDVESNQFHQKVYEGYMLLAAQTPRIKRIEGDQPVEQVVADIMKYINEYLHG
jgi:dTMP kinase